MLSTRIALGIATVAAAAALSLAATPVFAEEGTPQGAQAASQQGVADAPIEPGLFTLEELQYTIENVALRDAEWELLDGLQNITLQNIGP